MSLFLYADGACEGNQYAKNVGGWAVIIINDQQQIVQKLCGALQNTTNNRMELTACIEGLRYLQKHLAQFSIYLYTDSAYVVNCFRDQWYQKWRKNCWRNSAGKPVENRDLWEILITLVESFSNLRINHVKGHANNQWNNAADELAVQSIRNYKNNR